MIVKGSAGGRQSIDVRGVNVIDAKGIQLGAQVVDADEQNVFLSQFVPIS